MHYSETISASPSTFRFFYSRHNGVPITPFSLRGHGAIGGFLVSIPLQQPCNAQLGFPMRALGLDDQVRPMPRIPNIIVSPYTIYRLSWLYAVCLFQISSEIG